HTAETIKSLEGMRIAWILEAQKISALSLSLLRPTIRWEDPNLGKSEIWADWNPRFKSDPIEKLLGPHASRPTSSAVVDANWRDNPWFPDVLEQERLDSLRDEPELYAHIWEGDYATIVAGAYYAKQLAKAREEMRVGDVPHDPLLKVSTWWDLGKSD